MSRRNCIHPAAQRRRETASIIAYGDLRKALVSYLHTATASHNCWRPYNGTWLSIGQFPDLKMFPASQEEIRLLVPPGIALVTIALRAVNWGLYHRSKRANDYAPLSVSEEDLTRSDDEENEHSLSINAALKDDGLGVYLLRLTRLFCVLGLLSFSVRELIVGNSSLWTRVALLAFYVSLTQLCDTHVMLMLKCADSCGSTLLRIHRISIQLLAWCSNTGRIVVSFLRLGCQFYNRCMAFRHRLSHSNTPSRLGHLDEGCFALFKWGRHSLRYSPPATQSTGDSHIYWRDRLIDETV